MIRVLLAEDQGMIRGALAALLKLEDEWASALVLFSGSSAMTTSNTAAAGRLPAASRQTTGQSTWSAT